MSATKARAPLKIGLIGYGAIGEAIERQLAASGAAVEVAALLVREPSLAAAKRRAPEGVRVAAGWADFMAETLDLVVECAGHSALRAHAETCLASGCDLLIASVGALADAAFEARLRLPRPGGGRLIIPAGAVGGLDVLGAARRAGLAGVTYQSRKAPSAWRGTPAEAAVDLDAITRPTTFFTGTAREASLSYPKNANVVAAVALAGVGFDDTQVELIAEPGAPGNRHVVQAAGSFGEVSISVMAQTLPANPRTSLLAPCSMVRAIENMSAQIVI